MKKLLFFVLMIAVAFGSVFAQAEGDEDDDALLPEGASLVAQAEGDEDDDALLPEGASLVAQAEDDDDDDEEEGASAIG